MADEFSSAIFLITNQSRQYLYSLGDRLHFAGCKDMMRFIFMSAIIQIIVPKADISDKRSRISIIFLNK